MDDTMGTARIDINGNPITETPREKKERAVETKRRLDYIKSVIEFTKYKYRYPNQDVLGIALKLDEDSLTDEALEQKLDTDVSNIIKNPPSKRLTECKSIAECIHKTVTDFVRLGMFWDDLDPPGSDSNSDSDSSDSDSSDSDYSDSDSEFVDAVDYVRPVVRTDLARVFHVLPDDLMPRTGDVFDYDDLKKLDKRKSPSTPTPAPTTPTPAPTTPTPAPNTPTPAPNPTPAPTIVNNETRSASESWRKWGSQLCRVFMRMLYIVTDPNVTKNDIYDICTRLITPLHSIYTGYDLFKRYSTSTRIEIIANLSKMIISVMSFFAPTIGLLLRGGAYIRTLQELSTKENYLAVLNKVKQYPGVALLFTGGIGTLSFFLDVVVSTVEYTVNTLPEPIKAEAPKFFRGPSKDYEFFKAIFEKNSTEVRNIFNRDMNNLNQKLIKPLFDTITASIKKSWDELIKKYEAIVKSTKTIFQTIESEAGSSENPGSDKPDPVENEANQKQADEQNGVGSSENLGSDKPGPVENEADKTRANRLLREFNDDVIEQMTNVSDRKFKDDVIEQMTTFGTGSLGSEAISKRANELIRDYAENINPNPLDVFETIVNGVSVASVLGTLGYVGLSLISNPLIGLGAAGAAIAAGIGYRPKDRSYRLRL